ncbi:MAG: 1-deoxy-D-xylulose-5-phosphate reductoisomerase [Gammaproteobacteria bacterium]|nr:1-deoxy-D-xylulose-5-phosphate reductoisomerase [Gammaproteobacteria bacterium]MDH5802792.1 1-deoxy-D-xylulose-5-phosphate reductoisomerase [Gammaproteobacteria bacterium]
MSEVSGHGIGVTVLGATGTIGVNTLDVLARHPQRYRVVALTANRQVDRLYEQCLQHQPEYAVMLDETCAQQLEQKLQSSGLQIQVLSGKEGLKRVASLESAQYVMAAIVGAAGLEPTLAAAEAGKRVLLANKESLVMSGGLFMKAVTQNNAELLPIDSEHNAIFQCMPHGNGEDDRKGIRKILLTGSGGPFRNRDLASLRDVTPDQACAHPNWVMGRKISVDSATMMNKGLEFIEACWLFGMPAQDIEVLIHPQSVIHSMVEYVDGSVLAQLGNPDMRTPIAHALAWPERLESGVDRLDMLTVGKLEFEAPDYDRFPCLRLAMDAFEAGGTASAILNAANEVAVARFLENEIRFPHIPDIIEQTLAQIKVVEADCLETVMQADQQARYTAEEYINRNLKNGLH